MEINGEADEFDDDCEIEVSSFYGEGGWASPGCNGSGEEEEEGKDLMDVDEL